MKKNPIGIEDFKTLKENCYYVDKTELAKYIAMLPETTVCLFTRPRRFGKSLALSMLEYFFSNKYETRDLFKDTVVYQDEESMKYLNGINVIHINLKNIDSSNNDYFLYSLNSLMADLYKKNITKNEYSSLEDADKEFYDNLVNMRSSNVELKLSLEKLLRLVFELRGEKSLVLIDEYDAPLTEAYKNGFYDVVNDFMKLFLGSSLKGNDYLWKAVLTGVTQIAHSSALSDLNNLKVINVLNNLDKEFFGFNKNEVERLLSYYGFKEDIDKVHNYYGGYHISIDNVYNPWSILSFIDNGFIFKNYWSNTGSYILLRELIKRINDNDGEELRKLISGEGKIVNLDESVNFGDYNLINQTYTLLVFTGYLTSSIVLEPNSYLVKIPNEEIKMVFKSEILNTINYSNIDYLANLRNAFIEGDLDRIKEYFNNYILSSFSYFDLTTEKIYQIIVTTILTILFQDAIVKSEVNEGLGRCDIYLRFKDNRYSFIFEIKKLKGRRSDSELNKSSLSALSQIKSKKYYEEALRDNSQRILIYGLAFSGKSIVANYEEVNK